MVSRRRDSHARTTAAAVDVRKPLCLAKTSHLTCHVLCLPRTDSDGEMVWFNDQYGMQRDHGIRDTRATSYEASKKREAREDGRGGVVHIVV